MPPYGNTMRTLAFSCGRRGTAERWMRSWHLADAVFDGGLQALALLWVHSPLQKTLFPWFLFFAGVGAKKNYQKKRQKKTRKGGFLKKAPFKSCKNFWATDAEPSARTPKVARQPISPTAGGAGARKNFWATDAEPSVRTPKVARQPISPTAGGRGIPSRTQHRGALQSGRSYR